MRAQSLLAALCLALSFVAAGCSDNNGGTGATANNVFTATLSGANEVPPTGSTATGTATFTINGSTVDYQISVQNITDVVGGHIHSGEVGVSGPVRVTLVQPAPGVTTGVLAQGTFSAENVNGITYDEMVAEIRNGKAYVNVHTAVNRGGEIRGQLVPMR